MASVKENVLANGFALMTEDELYAVNGGRHIRDDPRERPETLHKDYDRTQREKLEKENKELRESIKNSGGGREKVSIEGGVKFGRDSIEIHGSYTRERWDSGRDR